VSSIDVSPRAYPRAKDYSHPLDSRHFVLVGILNVIGRDLEDHPGDDVGGPAGKPGHGVLGCSADGNHRLLFNLQRDQVEPLQRIALADQLPTKRRDLYSLELERAVREEKRSVRAVNSHGSAGLCGRSDGASAASNEPTTIRKPVARAC
jgi:hypothetical protein